MCKLSHVAYNVNFPESLPSEKRHIVNKTYITHSDNVFVNNNLSNIIEPRIMAVSGRQSMAKYG
jgi:hypothetical protein